jgi:hypothetical protein
VWEIVVLELEKFDLILQLNDILIIDISGKWVYFIGGGVMGKVIVLSLNKVDPLSRYVNDEDV